MKTADVCRKHDIGSATLYAWKAKHGGMAVSQASKLRCCRRRTASSNGFFAETMLDNAVLKEVAARHW